MIFRHATRLCASEAHKRKISPSCLARHPWAFMEPVEKWTTLVDVGRNGPKFLAATDSGGNVAGLPYPVRLKIVLSLVMWVRCLRDTQNTMARLLLPYASTTRLHRSGALRAEVYPTRHSERVVDFTSSVFVDMCPKRNPSGEQMPAPFLWDPEALDFVEEGEEAVPLKQSAQTTSEAADARLLRMLNIKTKRSNEDDAAEAAGQRVRYKSRARRASASLGADGVGRRGFTREALLSGRIPPPSPLDLDSSADAAHHRNTLRREGCPLSDEGELDACPVHVAVEPSASAENALFAYVLTHASILSSLYIEGRVVDFSTNDAALAAYVRCAFAHLIDAKYVGVNVVSAENTGVLLPRSYVPQWATRHAWCLTHEPGSAAHLKQITTVMMRSLLQGVAIVPSATCKALLLSALEDAQCTTTMRHPWNIAVVAPGDLSNALHHFYAVSTFTVGDASAPERCLRNVLQWMPENVRMVGVNAGAADLISYFPHAAYLPQKVGNAFRYCSVERSILYRRWDRMTAKRCCFSGFDDADRRRLASPLAATKDKASDALVLERIVEWLANPSKLSLLGLFSARCFRI